MKRDKCDICGDFKTLNEDDICYDCLQDEIDLEEELEELEELDDEQED
jgi:hypothetical protein